MELIKRELPLDYRIMDTGDWHVGSSNCHLDGIKAFIRRAVDTKSYVVLKGDLIEAIIPGDKRYSVGAVDTRFKTPKDQAKYVGELLKPIKDQIIGITIGNHEYKLLNIFDPIEMICDTAGLDYEHQYGAGIFKFIALNNGKIMHRMLFCHGTKSLPAGAKDPIQREANRLAAQKRNLEELGFADCIYASQGHHHQLAVVHPTVENHLYLTDDGKKIKQKYRVQSSQKSEYIPSESRFFAGTASYRKTYSSPGSKCFDYGEGKFPPAPLGHVELEIKSGELIEVKPYLA